MPKKKKDVTPVVTTTLLEVEVPVSVDQITVDFGREDLNALRDMVNKHERLLH